MGNASPSVLWNSAPYAGTSHIRREPAWAYYSQVSIAGPSGKASEHRAAVRSDDASSAKTVDAPEEPPKAVVQRGTPDGHREDGPWSLTQRELDVLQLLAEGATNSEISARLFISPKTTKNHLAAIFQKLDVTNRTHALVRAVVMGLVTIE
jgi:DNA-binding NarL/FixJ family response regulator